MINLRAMGGVCVQPIIGAAFSVLLFIAFGEFAVAGPEDQHAVPPAEVSNSLKQLIPGEEFLPSAVRAQQADDFDNPAYPFVEAGEAIWSKVEGLAGKSCQDCHGVGTENTIKRAAASYPKYAPDVKRVITLQNRINLCRENNLDASTQAEDSDQMLAMTVYLRWLARGSPSAVDVTGPNAEVFDRGRDLYKTKLGLLQLSCAQCHNDNFGHKFGADTLSQGHPLAYPAYEMGVSRVISLHQRFRMCNRLTRGEGQPDNAPDYIALELYINWRSKNLPFTTPGVRP